MKIKWYAPAPNDKRVVKRFAWFPTRVNDDIIWLETYWSYEQYIGLGIGSGYWAVLSRHLEKVRLKDGRLLMNVSE